MINLRKLSRSCEQSPSGSPSRSERKTTSSPSSRTRVSIRDRLLAQEIQELHGEMPAGCSITFSNPDSVHVFTVTVCPCDGMWKNGRFNFLIDVPLEYNNFPPRVSCQTKIWHPNVTESGAVCLSLLRPSSLDGTGWLPTRRLKDVILGLSSLFVDLVDFDDALNVEAADLYRRNPTDFRRKVEEYIKLYCV